MDKHRLRGTCYHRLSLYIVYYLNIDSQTDPQLLENVIFRFLSKRWRVHDSRIYMRVLHTVIKTKDELM